MASFATPEELTTWLQIPQMYTDIAQASLDAASGDVRAYCGWSISEETVTSQVLDGSGSRILFLPTLRLTAVASVVEDGETLVLGEDDDYVWTSDGRLYRYGLGYWPNYARIVAVTYTHGYAAGAIPAVVQRVCKTIAARIYGNVMGLRSETVGGVSWTAAGASGDLGPGLTLGEERALASLRLPVVG